jgi:UDP-glucose 4-epimerase
VGDLATALLEMFDRPGPVQVIGTRHGEKLHETLLSREERARAQDRDRYFCVRADDRDLNYRKYFVEGERRISELQDYTSENTDRLKVPEIKQLLVKHDLISGTVDA